MLHRRNKLRQNFIMAEKHRSKITDKDIIGQIKRIFTHMLWHSIQQNIVNLKKNYVINLLVLYTM